MSDSHIEPNARPVGQGAASGRRAAPNSSRSKARREALDILFEADQRGKAPTETLSDRYSFPARENPPREFASRIVRGVVEHADAIDDAIATYSQGWTLERMPAVDLAALRIGVWEILWHEDTPDGVAVSEAVAMVSDLSTDESPTFVNGLLSRIVEVKPTLL